MTTHQKLESAHKEVAEVAGQMSLSLTTKKLTRTQLAMWQLKLDQAQATLKELA